MDWSTHLMLFSAILLCIMLTLPLQPEPTSEVSHYVFLTDSQGNQSNIATLPEQNLFNETGGLSASFPDPSDWPADTLILYSGTLARSQFAPEPRNWMGTGLLALENFCVDERNRINIARRHLLFQPHARHILNDYHNTRQFLNIHSESPYGIALAPLALLERNMLRDARDHLSRILDALGSCADLIIVDIEADAHSETGAELAQLHKEMLPLHGDRTISQLIAELIKDHVPAETPIAIRPSIGANIKNHPLSHLLDSDIDT